MNSNKETTPREVVFLSWFSPGYRRDLDQLTKSPRVVVELLCDEEDDDPE